uniref:Uncharacterized protein n=1 Tax=Arundo donax TaxID=35708 RepID=A0A0A9D6Y2_ARUDO
MHTYKWITGLLPRPDYQIIVQRVGKASQYILNFLCFLPLTPFIPGGFYFTMTHITPEHAHEFVCLSVSWHASCTAGGDGSTL